MPSPATSTSSQSIPPFSCRIPQPLLDKVADEERDFYIRNDLMDQKMDWLVASSTARATMLEEVLVQTRTTNGAVAKAARDIEDLRNQAATQAAQTAPVVKAYGFAQVAVRNKWCWAAAVLFFTIVAPWLVTIAPAPLVVLKAVGGVLFGL